VDLIKAQEMVLVLMVVQAAVEMRVKLEEQEQKVKEIMAVLEIAQVVQLLAEAAVLVLLVLLVLLIPNQVMVALEAPYTHLGVLQLAQDKT
jgi:hypothetical protein